jgi:hypothetical protein
VSAGYVLRLAPGILAIAVLTACSDVGLIYQSTGVADTTTPWMDLEPGRYVVRYAASDHMPLLGCTFAVAVVRQPGDPLAAGIPVVTGPEVRVPPKGETRGGVDVFIGAADTYYLWVTGTCRWTVELRAA